MENQAKKLLYDFETIRIRMILGKMNFDYALGLYDGEIDFISEIQNPLSKLPDYIDNESPTLEKFQTELFSRVDHFLKSTPLSQEEQEYIRKEAYWKIEHTDQNELNEIIESYKEGIPKEFYFLKGKIDFTAASLSLLMSIAEDEENMKLQNHLLKIQEKRNSL
ncbi:MAG: hypothetical protein E7643_03280 [Ruminococcaceae bacterium]|nr:hypothetical protein [Oscillospiraceae bacterium]